MLEEMRVYTRLCLGANTCMCGCVCPQRAPVCISNNTVCVLTLRLAYHMLHALFISIKIIKK